MDLAPLSHLITKLKRAAPPTQTAAQDATASNSRDSKPAVASDNSLRCANVEWRAFLRERMGVK